MFTTKVFIIYVQKSLNGKKVKLTQEVTSLLCKLCYYTKTFQIIVIILKKSFLATIHCSFTML